MDILFSIFLNPRLKASKKEVLLLVLLFPSLALVSEVGVKTTGDMSSRVWSVETRRDNRDGYTTTRAITADERVS